MKKKCTLCKKDKELDEFNKNSGKPDGHSNVCRLCAKEHSKDYYERNKKKLKSQINNSKKKRVGENKERLYDYLTLHPCVDCGENDPVVLEFDHVKGIKLEIVSRLVNQGFSWKKILNEIKKCIVRCANCHRRKTAKDFNWYKTKTPS